MNEHNIHSLSEAGSDSELSSESSASEELDESTRCARAACSDDGTMRRESGISSIASSESEPPCTQVTNGDNELPIATTATIYYSVRYL